MGAKHLEFSYTILFYFSLKTNGISLSLLFNLGMKMGKEGNMAKKILKIEKCSFVLLVFFSYTGMTPKCVNFLTISLPY